MKSVGQTKKMNTRIFYFTGTGNSLFLAKEIAEKIGGCIDPIVGYMEQKSLKIKEDVIGIVFPVYLAQIYGVPKIVKEFIEKIEYDKNKYYFILCTYGGYAYPNAFPTIKNCIKIAKSQGGIIKGRFYIRFPMNNLDYAHLPFYIEKNTTKILKKSDDKTALIAKRILKQKKGNRFTQKSFNCTVGPLLSIAKKPIMKAMKKYAKQNQDSKLTYHQLVYLSDQSILFDKDQCTACGICEKVCPVGNVIIHNGIPIWQHHCEMCLACDQWCPQKAIHHWSKIKGKDYHHPSIDVNDLISQRGSKVRY